MMNWTSLLALLAFALVLSVLHPSFVKTNEDTGIVFYFPFEAERITGIPQRQIEQYGCRYTIRRSDFLGLLGNGNGRAYEARDIRAKVIFADATHYIDYAGVVSMATGETRTIDKDGFVSSLTYWDCPHDGTN